MCVSLPVLGRDYKVPLWLQYTYSDLNKHCEINQFNTDILIRSGLSYTSIMNK